MNDDYYSQGESDDEEKVTNTRNLHRYGWKIYQLDNPCSILFLKENSHNEGFITFFNNST